MLIIAGILIILCAVYFLVKQYETRMVLFLAGVAMATIAGSPLGAFTSFSHALAENRLFEPIITVMGFAVVMKVTECDKHLIQLLAKYVKRAGPLLIPGAVFATLFVNSSLTSAAGSAAAVGAILIPLLIASGVHPAAAASAVLAGTYGSMFNPGFSMNIVIADVIKANPVDIVANHFFTVLICGAIGAFSLTLIAYLRKEHQGYVLDSIKEQSGQEFQISFIKAAVPLVPLALILFSNAKLIPGLKPLAISHAMIIGVFVAFVVTRMSPGKLSKEFFHGLGEAFGHIFGIIACALVFVDGMKAVGLVKALTDAMIANPAIAKISAGFGPFLLAVISGSGDAAATAFNKAITVNAVQFGVVPSDMGSMAALGGAMGRSMSPLAGAAIICAAFANVSPMELAKRNALGMVLACAVATWLLMFK